MRQASPGDPAPWELLKIFGRLTWGSADGIVLTSQIEVFLADGKDLKPKFDIVVVVGLVFQQQESVKSELIEKLFIGYSSCRLLISKWSTM